jgi:hypothetical protein
MKVSDLKQKIVEILKKDANEPHEKFDFRQTVQYEMAEMIIGYAFIIYICMAVSPSTLELKFLVPQDGGYTILNLFPIIILGYVLVYSSKMFGSWILDHLWIIATDIKNRVSIPQFISDSLMIIVVFAFIAFKLLYPTALGGVK